MNKVKSHKVSKYKLSKDSIKLKKMPRFHNKQFKPHKQHKLSHRFIKSKYNNKQPRQPFKQNNNKLMQLKQNKYKN